MKLSIIIPVFNEFPRISKVIDKVVEESIFKKEIIIIDDFSDDGTRELLKEKLLKKKIDILILNDRNYGKGYSVRQGFAKCSGDICLIQDADLEYDPSDYKILVEPIIKGEAEVVYGSRFYGSGIRRSMFFWHTIGNKFITFVSNLFTNLNLTDVEVGYKVFKTEIIKKINLEENRFGFEPEITAKISRLNIRIFEVGVNYYGRNYMEGKKITWVDGFNAIWSIIKYNTFKK